MATNTGNPTTQEGAAQHAGKMVEEAKAFASGISETANHFTESLDLSGRVQRHPIGMVCAAVGVGYLLGGGLFSPLTGRLITVGTRLGLLALVKAQIAGKAKLGPSASRARRSESSRPVRHRDETGKFV